MPGSVSRNAAILTKPGEFSLLIRNGVVIAGWSLNVSQAGTTVLTPGTWYYIAVTYDGTTLTIYLDGATEATLAYSGPGSSPTSSDFMIGAVGAANDPFDIWSVTLYSTARSAEQEFNAPWVDLAPSPGLVANYDFSVAPPRETVASHPIGAQNGALSQTLAPAVYLNGAKTGVQFGSEPIYALPAQFTVSAWVALSSLSGFQPIFLWPGCSFGLNSGYLWGLIQPSPPEPSQSFGTQQPIPINICEWHNFALTCDGTVVTLYLDGKPVASTTLSSPMRPSGYPFLMFAGYNGNIPPNEFSLNGYVQWVTVWSRCLSANEVAFQQYGSVSGDIDIVLDAALDNPPLDDLAAALPIQFIGPATTAVQRVTVTTWSPPPQQLHPPSPPTTTTAKRLEKVNWPIPIADPTAQSLPQSPKDPLATDAELLDRYLKGLDDGAAASLRSLYQRKTHEALKSSLANSSQKQVAYWRPDGGELVLVFHHPQDGEMELWRVRASDITPCQQWWATFSFTLLAGLLNLFFIPFRGEELTTWAQRQILGRQTVMQALYSAWNQYPAFSGATVLALVQVIYQLSLVKDFLWFVAYQAGYAALLRLFAYLASIQISEGPLAVTFAANAAQLAVQLGIKVPGAPDQPGYNEACGMPPAHQ